MTRLLRTLAIAALLTCGTVWTACAPDDGVSEEAGAAAELSPEELGRLGARIESDPERTEAILEEAGLTWEEFEAAVRAVSADTGKARRYAEAFTAAGGEGEPPGT